VLCVESVDGGASVEDGLDLDALRVDVTAAPDEGADGVTVRGHAATPPDAPWPYDSVTGPARRMRRVAGADHRGPDGDPGAEEGRLGAIGAERAPASSVRLIPYHRWARRGPSTMRIWLPTTTCPPQTAPAEGDFQ
jgi:hypothetical protein